MLEWRRLAANRKVRRMAVSIPNTAPLVHFTPSLSRYQFILLGEQRHTCVNKLPRVAPSGGTAWNRTRNLSITNPTPYRYTMHQATSIWVMGIYTPKISPSKLLSGKNDVRTAIEQFYTPKTNFWLRPRLRNEPVVLFCQYSMLLGKRCRVQIVSISGFRGLCPKPSSGRWGFPPSTPFVPTATLRPNLCYATEYWLM